MSNKLMIEFCGEKYELLNIEHKNGVVRGYIEKDGKKIPVSVSSDKVLIVTV